MNKEEIKPIIAEMKEILNKYPDRQLEILLYVFGRDNLMRIINEPTYEQLQRENQQLKEKYLEYKKDFFEANDMLFEFQTKNKQLKSTLEEIREYIKEELKRLETTNDKITHCLSYQDLIDEYNNISQIIDKGVNNEL